jgi:hypothetical protein
MDKLTTAGETARAAFGPFLNGPLAPLLGPQAVFPVGQTASHDCLAAMAQLRAELDAAVCHVQAELSLSRQQTTAARQSAEHDGLTAGE